MVSRDGEAAICPRTPSDRDLGEAGYLHRLDEPIPQGAWSKQVKVKPECMIDFEAMSMACHQRFMELELAEPLSEELGVSQFALVAFTAGWSDRRKAFTFPMCDAQEKAIGIRLRSKSGDKYAVTGSKSGIFSSLYTPINDEGERSALYICEGPSDAMALFDMGLRAVGRPSCMGGTEIILNMLRGGGHEVVIVADNDPPKLMNGKLVRPGRKGADALAQRIRKHCRSLKVIEPYQAKDVRAMSQFGDGRDKIEQLVQAAKEWRPL